MNRINLFAQKGKNAFSLLLKGNISELTKDIKYYLSYGFNPLVDEDQLKPQLIKALRYLKEMNPNDQEFGDYLEFGVSHGSSMLCMYQALQELQLGKVRLFGFDSFEGLPKEANNEGTWKEGQFAANINDVKAYLSKNGIDWEKVVLKKGWFHDTLIPKFKEDNNISKISIIMIDCDLYSSTVEALKFCEDLLCDYAIIIFDDWESGIGEKKAFDEFKKRNSNFKIDEFSTYNYRGKPAGKIFFFHGKL